MITWKEFLSSLITEDDIKFATGEKLTLTILASPRGETDEDGTHWYERPQKLSILINEVRSVWTKYIEMINTYTVEVEVSCTTMEPIPPGFKHGTYTLHFSCSGGSFICCKDEPGISQMALDEIISTDQWEQIQEERRT